MREMRLVKEQFVGGLWKRRRKTASENDEAVSRFSTTPAAAGYIN